MELTLDAIETRVVGALIEKQLSTPDYYPMTLNALRQACNQKSNRDPVVSFSESDVVTGLDGLQRKRLVGVVSGAGSRVEKYRHAVAEALTLGEPELAVLAVLLLRGPQTVGEIRGRTGRLHAFASLDVVQAVLNKLEERDDPLVAVLPTQAGQKEPRYMHLLAGEPDLSAWAQPAPTVGDAGRLEHLEQEVAQLKEDLQALSEAFAAFRAQFE